MRTREEVDDAFTHHPPSQAPDPGARVAQHEQARDIIKSAALSLFDLLPNGPDKTLALRKLEMALFHSNAAIARQG